MDKVKRKEILCQLAKKDLGEFRKNLPMDENAFPKLFNFINEKLSAQDCQNDFTIANQFCDKHHINKQVLFNWLNEQSQACDCEILNLENVFEYLIPPIPIRAIKTEIKKQKLISLKTDYGFCIDKVALPWTLTETILEDKTIYTFQIGKGTDCIVNLETSFPTEQISNDKYWLDLWIKQTKLNYDLDELVVERPEIENYSCIVVKSKNWLPVFYWFKNDFTDKWYLRMRTGSNRHKGDFKELAKLLKSIRLDE